MKFASAATVGIAAAALATTALAELPKKVMITAYGVGTSGYSQAVALGSVLKNNNGVTMRVLPGKNDLSRLAPVRSKKAQFSFNGLGTFMSQEAAFVFAKRNWGPQKTRVLAFNFGDNCLIPYVAGDLGVKTAYDLKGKRVAIIKAAPALNYNVYTYLRFAGLTWDDVERVEFGGSSSAQEAIASGKADVAFTSTISNYPRKQEATPRGLSWPATPHDDDAGWKRFFEAAPYYVKKTCTDGVGLSKDKPLEGALYPYPVFMSYPDVSDDTAYSMTKTLFDNYDAMKDSAPGMKGWGIDNQELSWVVPIHNGAVRYYKEIGKWNADHQKNTDEMLRRQDVVGAAWDATKAANEDKDDETFFAAWKSARAAALTAAGFAPVWTEWPNPK
ncbi:MAG: TAXI family TRAP transporter solute-binding subunit [Alphaproteobacteria bacterium]